MKTGKVGIQRGQQAKRSPFISGDDLLSNSGFHYQEEGSLSKWTGFSKDINSVVMPALPLGETVTGLFQYSKSDGTKFIIACGTTKIYKQSGGVWITIRTGQTGTADDVYDFSVLNDILYLCNGKDPNLKTDGSNVFAMGVAAPTTAVTATETIGGSSLTAGTYIMTVTFLNTAMNHESNPSPSTTITLLANNNTISLSAIPISTDPQVTARRIYVTPVNGALPLFAAEIANNTATTLNIIVTATGIAVEEFANGTPPVFKAMHLKEGFIWGMPVNSSILRFSGAGKPNAWHANDFRDLDSNDGDMLTGIAEVNGRLIAFKNQSIWNGFGSDRFDFDFIKRVEGIGSINNRGISNVPGKDFIMFASRRGFYAYDGVQEVKMSDAIDPIYRLLVTLVLQKCFSVIREDQNSIWWLLSTKSTFQNNVALIWDYAEEKWSTRPYPLLANYGTQFIDLVNGSNVLMGGYTGIVHRSSDAFTDDGTAIEAFIVTRPYPSGIDTDMEKCFYGITVLFNPQAGSVIGCAIAVNTETSSFIDIGAIDASNPNGQFTIDCNLQGKRIFVKLHHIGNMPCVIRGIVPMWYSIGFVETSSPLVSPKAPTDLFAAA